MTDQTYNNRGVTERILVAKDALTGQELLRVGPFEKFELSSQYAREYLSYLGRHPVQMSMIDTNDQFPGAVVRLVSAPMTAKAAKKWVKKLPKRKWGGSGP